MDVRRVVGGALTRNAVVRELLWNYAERLERSGSGPDGCAPCFIVPEWSTASSSCAPSGTTVVTVHAHASRTDPGRGDRLDAVLRVLHAALTDERVSPLITARRVSTAPRLRTSELGTVVRSGVWTIAPVAVGAPALAPATAAAD